MESTNLFNDPKYKDKIRDLPQLIRNWRIQTGDTKVVATGIRL